MQVDAYHLQSSRDLSYQAPPREEQKTLLLQRSPQKGATLFCAARAPPGGTKEVEKKKIQGC